MAQALLHSTVKMTVLPLSHKKKTCMVTAVVTNAYLPSCCVGRPGTVPCRDSDGQD